MTDWDEKQVENWHLLFEGVSKILMQYGAEYHSGKGDYLLVEDNYGWQRITFSVQNLTMLKPDIIRRLRDLLSDFQEWEIVVAVDIPGREKTWPVMGLTIRKREVIDGLQRQYFPQEFQNWQYEDSKPGTGYD